MTVSRVRTSKTFSTMSEVLSHTSSLQVFTTCGPTVHFDRKYSAFGKVIDGLEMLDALEKLPGNEKMHQPLGDGRITIYAN